MEMPQWAELAATELMHQSFAQQSAPFLTWVRRALDGDGDTDFNDILLVLSNFGSDGSAGGDADEDGDVDFNDLITLLSAFGPCP